MKKYFILVLCAFLSVGLVTGCGSKKEEKKENNIKGSDQIESCPNCVFAYYNDEMHPKHFSSDPNEYKSKLDEYTMDYTELKDENGNQRLRFLGHVLNENNEILKGYVCGIENGKAFCIEGAESEDSDNTKDIYEKNKKIMIEVFGKDKCKENIGTYYNEFTCNKVEYDSSKKELKVVNGDVYATTNSWGESAISTNKNCGAGPSLICYD